MQYTTLLFLFFLLTACSKTEKEIPPPDNPEEPQETTTLPSGLRDGITAISDDSLAFVLFAPKKREVHLIGDFNDWQKDIRYKMKKDGDRFWIKIGGLEKGKEYICQYLINGQLRIADPYANKISDPWNDKDIPASIYPNLIAYPTNKTSEIAMTVSTDPVTYPWQVDDFKISDPTNMVIYEILLRDFTTERSIKAAQEKIPYLKALGVNAIELMPFNEFEGNDSWGYNPSFYFAPDKAYGTPEDYKAFIDACHVNGMGVIMDIVLNHSFGQSPLIRMYQDGVAKPSADNPWYNQQSNFANPDAQWGADFNHDSPYTQQLVDSICSYWMKMYKIDGFRFDFTKGFSNTPYPASGDNAWGNAYDAARIKNLKRIYNALKSRNPNALMICEHLSDNQEETELANYGLLLWGNMNSNFNEATMGYNESGKSDLHWASYKERGWLKPHLIAYMESHDEERIMYKNQAYGASTSGYNVKNLPTALTRTEAAAVMLMTFPGPKMIWQFGELGYDIALQEGGADRLAPKPPHWEYYNIPARKSLYDIFATMNRLKQTHAAFSTSDYQIQVNGAFKQILLKTNTENICAMANFDIIPAKAIVNFGKSGNWKDHFSGNILQLNNSSQEIILQPGEYRLYFQN